MRRRLASTLTGSASRRQRISRATEAKRRMINGNFFESELQRFFEWLDKRFEEK
jgi:hypothetical protein